MNSPTCSRTNRLEESKNIFDTIVNNTAFQSISVILFLNKSDLLALKVKNPETDIRWYYPQYTGNPHSIIDVQTFILQMFLRVRRNNSHHLQSLKPPQPIYHHFTTAVDTQNIQVVFNSVKDTILQRNLASLMLQWKESTASEPVFNCYLFCAFPVAVMLRVFPSIPLIHSPLEPSMTKLWFRESPAPWRL
jgi:hypothetical protein